METELKTSLGNVLSLELPGFKLSDAEHKTIIDDLSNQVLPVFERIYKHPENNSKYKIKARQFFGAHPVSFEKKHFKEIKEQPQDFLVCEKTDGTRYLMYINNFGEVYLSGRGDDFYLVNIPLPSNMINEKLKENSVMYIFDGELVIDKVQGKEMLIYLLFDCILFAGDLVFDKVYLDRLSYCLKFVTLREDLTKPSDDHKVLSIGPLIEQIEKTKQPPIKVCVKDFYRVQDCGFIFNQLVPTLAHENDGLIFTRNSKPYPVGATSSIIKWKPPQYNTIDFLVVNNCGWEPKYGKTILDLYVTRFNKYTQETEYVLFDMMAVDEEKYIEIAQNLGIRKLEDYYRYNPGNQNTIKIIAECKFDEKFTTKALYKFVNNYWDRPGGCVNQMIKNSALSSHLQNDKDVRNNLHFCLDIKAKSSTGGWVMSRIRKDKNMPNAFGTAKSVFNCIFENIRIEDLDKEFQSISTEDTSQTSAPLKITLPIAK